MTGVAGAVDEFMKGLKADAVDPLAMTLLSTSGLILDIPRKFTQPAWFVVRSFSMPKKSNSSIDLDISWFQLSVSDSGNFIYVGWKKVGFMLYIYLRRKGTIMKSKYNTRKYHAVGKG